MNEWLESRPPRRIVGATIVLRTWGIDDTPAFTAAVSESMDHLRPWMPWAGASVTLETQRTFIAEAAEQFEEGTAFRYGIFDPNEKAILGACGLTARIGPNALDIGYWVGSRHVQRGYATAAARSLAEAAFALPEVHRVEIRCDVSNTASAAIPKRIGFRLARIEPRAIEAPAEVGRAMIWVADRPPDSSAGLLPSPGI